ncbi:unnamed protein product [Nippostrongylus brasiliensis]|uniref:Nucleotid_trans domain-containing protein n=1 Tax=Nippostrongylus brasiliensis TaxID=27835 RepID=A0A0N4YJZ9_NIPBR|nr:unnamed protein product [Nippostrongylus brasiliensis]
MMLLEHDTVLYMDTSVQWNNDRLDYLHNRTSPILINEFTGHGIFPAVHPDVYKFIPTKMEALLRTSEHGATAIYVRRTPEAMSIIKWWVLCALEEKCMSPPGSQLGCQFGADRYKDYAKCHRFDQAVLNMLLANVYSYEPERYTTGLTGKDLHVERGTSTPKDDLKNFMCDETSISTVT